MKDQSASGILATAIDKIKDMVDCQTIIGDPIDAGDGIKVIPISKVTYGFASGGSDFPSKSAKELFGGGGGAGVTISPVAFLVINKGEVHLRRLRKLCRKNYRHGSRRCKQGWRYCQQVQRR